MTSEDTSGLARLDRDLSLLWDMLAGAVARLDGAGAAARMEELRGVAGAVRNAELEAGGDELARRVGALSARDLGAVANAFTDLFHLVNAAEEQHRIRVLRERDAAGDPRAHDVAGACAELRRAGVGPDDVRALLQRLLVMPVITAHPTEARRRTASSTWARSRPCSTDSTVLASARGARRRSSRACARRSPRWRRLRRRAAAAPRRSTR